MELYPLQPASASPPAYQEIAPRVVEEPYAAREFPQRYTSLFFDISRTTASVLQERADLVEKIARQKSTSYTWVRQIGVLTEQMRQVVPQAHGRGSESGMLSSQEDYLSLNTFLLLQEVVLADLLQQKEGIERAIQHTMQECQERSLKGRKVIKTIMDGATLDGVAEICFISRDSFTGFCQLYQEQVAFFEEEHRTLGAILPQMQQAKKAAEGQIASMKKIANAREGVWKKMCRLGERFKTPVSSSMTWVLEQIPALPQQISNLSLSLQSQPASIQALPSPVPSYAALPPNAASAWQYPVPGIPLPLPSAPVRGIPLSEASFNGALMPVRGIPLNVTVATSSVFAPSAPSPVEPNDCETYEAVVPNLRAAFASSSVSVKGGSKRACVVESA